MMTGNSKREVVSKEILIDDVLEMIVPSLRDHHRYLLHNNMMPCIRYHLDKDIYIKEK